MSELRQRPWLDQYPQGRSRGLDRQFDSVLDAFRWGIEFDPSLELYRFFDSPITAHRVDRLSDAVACLFLARGISRGDRVAISLQNIPQYPVVMLACWKIGAVIVSVNPMYRERELRRVLTDSGASALVFASEVDAAVVSETARRAGVRFLFTTAVIDLLSQPGLPVVLPRGGPRSLEGVPDLLRSASAFAEERPPAHSPDADSTAALSYTSGTTGTAKGAINTHGGLAFNAQAFRDFAGLKQGEGIYAAAPLFHITGLVTHLSVGLITWAPITLAYRFDAGTCLELIERHRCASIAGATTVFVSLLDHEGLGRRDLGSLRSVVCGGSALPAAFVERFEAATGLYVHNCFGLTETTAPVTQVPPGRRAPVDRVSGALSVGVPMFDTDVAVLTDDGVVASAQAVGELVVKGPQVTPGYWRNPAETEALFAAGWMRTGDVGFVDEAGWVYVIDRKKDQINASGYKVWPREVEDVLGEHPGIAEAAVVGIPDPYRGETVQAHVVLRPGADLTERDVIDFCRERLAVFKAPQSVLVRSSLPKTESGKIIRRDLRNAVADHNPDRSENEGASSDGGAPT